MSTCRPAAQQHANQPAVWQSRDRLLHCCQLHGAAITESGKFDDEHFSGLRAHACRYVNL